MSLNNKFWDSFGLISRGQACSVPFQDLFCLPTTQHNHIRKSVDQNHVMNQRHKNHRGIVALPSGKFLRVRKVFARNPWNCTGKFLDGLESFRIVLKVSG